MSKPQPMAAHTNDERWRRAARAVAYAFSDGALAPLHESILALLLAAGRAVERGDIHRRVGHLGVTVADVQCACTEGRLARLVTTADRGDGRGVLVRCAVPREVVPAQQQAKRARRRRILVREDDDSSGETECTELITAALERLRTLADIMCARAGVDALDAPDFERNTRMTLLNDGFLAHEHAERILRVAREVHTHVRTLQAIRPRITAAAATNPALPLPKRSRSA